MAIKLVTIRFHAAFQLLRSPMAASQTRFARLQVSLAELRTFPDTADEPSVPDFWKSNPPCSPRNSENSKSQQDRNYERSRGIWTNLFGGSKKNSEENSEK